MALEVLIPEAIWSIPVRAMFCSLQLGSELFRTLKTWSKSFSTCIKRILLQWHSIQIRILSQLARWQERSSMSQLLLSNHLIKQKAKSEERMQRYPLRANSLRFIFGELQQERLLHKYLDSTVVLLGNSHSHLQAKSCFRLERTTSTLLQFMTGPLKLNYATLQ